MKVKTLYFPLFFILSIFIVQQLPAQSSKRNAIIDDIVKSHTDSLDFYRKKCDSLRLINDSVMQSMGYPADNKYFRLFSPLAYYPDIANRALRMDESCPWQTHIRIPSIRKESFLCSSTACRLDSCSSACSSALAI